MGLSYTVSGDITSFRTPSRVPIESLKFHFLPKQAAGTPSPENPIPIEGWNKVTGYLAGRNLVEWLNPTMTVSSRYNGYSGWVKPWKIPDRTKKYRYRVYIDNTNGDDYAMANVWLMDETATSYTSVVGGNRLAPGEKGYSTVTITASSYQTSYYICWGVSLRPNTTASEPIVELYNDNTNGVYEGYLGNDIPICFSATKNLFDGSYTKCLITGNSTIGYTIGMSGTNANSAVIPCIPNMQYTVKKHASSNRFSVGTCAKSPANNVPVDLIVENSLLTQYTFTTSPTAKYLVAYVSTGSEMAEPALQIEYGDTASAYEESKPIYGGYIDPVAGEIVAEYALYETTWGANNAGTVLGDTKRKGFYVGSIEFADAIDLHNNGQGPYGKYRRTLCNIVPWGWDYFSDYPHYYINNHDINLMMPVDTSDDTVIQFCALLKTPIHIPIPAEDLKAFLDRNSFWSDTNDITEVTYAVTESKDMLATRKKAIDFDHAHHKKVKWNQLIVDGNFTDSTKWATNANYGQVSVNNNIGTWTCSVTPDYYYRTGIMESREHLNIPETHKILMRATVRSSVAIRIALYALALGNEHSNPYYQDITVNEWTTIFGFVVQRNAEKFFAKGKICYGASSQNIGNIVPGTTLEAKDFMMFDLTQMFGVGNEPTTAAEFERICKLNGIDLTTYQPYDAGSDRWLIVP